MRKRKILRFALLQEYLGDPFSLLDDIPEVAAAGYEGVAFFPFGCTTEFLRPACDTAQRHGLLVYVLTGYMKYQQDYLAKHPDQMLVRAQDTIDQDGLSTSGQGCPFNPRFKERYFEVLRELATLPAIDTISLNDEATLGLGCYCAVCQADYAKEIGGEMPRPAQATAELWQDPGWRRFVRWRIDRWNAVHAEMADVIRAVNPRVQVAFQASPASDLIMGNPWFTGIDIHAMAQNLDAFSVDPYYTFHQDNPFRPREVYLSEWSRFLAGIVPTGKRAEIVPQAFTHPTFTRPLGEQDGLWAALIPPACGVDAIIPYAYRMQRETPMHETFHRCFALHRYFEDAEPLKYAGVVHGVKTEMFVHAIPAKGPQSYDATRPMVVAESLRTAGVPYGYVADAQLADPEALSAYPLLILPEVLCVSDTEAEGLKRYLIDGGNLIVIGNLGTADETGSPRRASVLEELTGIRAVRELIGEQAISITPGHPLEATLRWYDAAAAKRYHGGSFEPACTLRRCVQAEVPANAEVIASFDDDSAAPAIVRPRRGLLWIAGLAERLGTRLDTKTSFANTAFRLFAALVPWHLGAGPALRVEAWPPETPIRRLRPLDPRNTLGTFEFFPLTSTDGYLALLTSYMRERADIVVAADIPSGARLNRVTERIGGQPVPFEVNDSVARVRVSFGFDEAAKLLHFEITRSG